MSNGVSRTLRPKHWCRVDYNELPPEAEEVWTTDGHVVRRGTWTFPGVDKALEENTWKDLQGASIEVTHWIPVEASPNAPPPVPAFTEFAITVQMMTIEELTELIPNDIAPGQVNITIPNPSGTKTALPVRMEEGETREDVAHRLMNDSCELLEHEGYFEEA